MSKSPLLHPVRGARIVTHEGVAAAKLSLSVALSILQACLGGFIGAAVVGCLAGGCGQADGADEFRAGVPQHEDVVFLVPGASAQESAVSDRAVNERHAALFGQTADLYVTTRDITGAVNRATAAVLILVKSITEFLPTSIRGDVAVWGPHTPPLSQNTWRLTVNRLGGGVFHYVLEAKARAADDATYLTILSGQHNASDPGARRRSGQPAYGSGNFVLDWDNAHQLPEHEANVGRASFTYSRPSVGSEVNIASTFTQVRDEATGMLIDAMYGYIETPGLGGSFQFTLTKDSIATTPAAETLSVRSRWQEDGAGRADVRVTGGDLGTSQATANECWNAGDEGFASVYTANSYGDPTKAWGVETYCVFPTADYAMF